MRDIKKEMKERAWAIRGLVNALKYDAEYIESDAKNYDIICMGESIRDTKNTIQQILDNVAEIEHLLYLTKDEV